MGKPRIAITIGDPAGIGPEIALKAANDKAVRRACALTLVGPRELWQTAARQFGMDIRHCRIVDVPAGSCAICPGRDTAHTGRIAAESVLAAARLCREGETDALATTPISKRALQRAGYPQTAHTELLSAFCRARPTAMMFASDRIKLTLATIHVPLSAVPGLLTRALIAEKIGLTARALRSWWGLRRPRIDVLGLNPHAGEGGMMGSEERRIIRPAVARCHERNCAVTGPLSAEAGLRRALEGRCDALVAMYHDQGLLPLKALGGATNVTLGLPFVRTSPDHGTAMDIAWRNRADPGPMVRAVLLAARLAAE